MNTTNLSTLKIHKLSKEQYERELAAGRIDENALYLTPAEETILGSGITAEQLNGKADKDHNHDNAYDTKGSADSALTAAKKYTDDVVAAAKNEFGAGSGGGSDPNAVKYTAQNLTEEQKAQARANIGIECSSEEAIALLAEVGIIAPTAN